MIKTSPKPRRNPGYLDQSAQHKAVQVRAYLSHRTWLLKILMKDAERLKLEPFETYEIYFSKEASR
jgi:hypothetical protein